MKLDINYLKSINVDWVDKEMNSGASQNNNVFRILSYMASFFKNEIILDLGTNVGASALALRNQNDDNIIISYDIQKNVIPYGDFKYKNIYFKIIDANTEHPSILKNSKLMYLDIDPHDGFQETVFFQKLRSINYTGIVICDDIHINRGMEIFWASIPEYKIDITHCGHYSGTGIVCFGGKIETE